MTWTETGHLVRISQPMHILQHSVGDHELASKLSHRSPGDDEQPKLPSTKSKYWPRQQNKRAQTSSSPPSMTPSSSTASSVSILIFLSSLSSSLSLLRLRPADGLSSWTSSPSSSSSTFFLAALFLALGVLVFGVAGPFLATTFLGVALGVAVAASPLASVLTFFFLQL